MGNFRDDIATALAGAVIPSLTQVGYTGIEYAQIGNGDYPPVVLVPPHERKFNGAIYIFAQEDNGKNKVMQALVDCADIPYPEQEAFAHIVAGYPPGENQVLTVFRRNTPRQNTGFGGATGLRSSLTQLASRDIALRLVPTSPPSLTLLLSEGFYRIGGQSYYAADNVTFLDVSAYLPASGMGRYIGVGIDRFASPVVIEGAAFSLPEPTPANYIPTTWGNDTAALGWVYLTDDLTAITDSHIQNDTTSRYAPGASDTGFVQATDPGAVGSGSQWVDTSAGAGNWVLKVRNTTNTGWEPIRATPPSTPIEITGSTSGNAALQNLLAALESLGIITDSTT